MRKYPKRRKKEKINQVLELLHISGLEDRYPRQLSGGQVHRETEKTAIYVAHDQITAFAISDKIALLEKGGIRQVVTPVELYLKPMVSFAMEFIDSTNLLHGKVVELSHKKELVIVDCGPFKTRASQYKPKKVGQSVTVDIKASDIHVIKEEDRENYENIIDGKIEAVIFAGEKSIVRVKKDGIIIQVHVFGSDRYSYLGSENKRVILGFNQCVIF